MHQTGMTPTSMHVHHHPPAFAVNMHGMTLQITTIKQELRDGLDLNGMNYIIVGLTDYAHGCRYHACLMHFDWLGLSLYIELFLVLSQLFWFLEYVRLL